MDIIVINNVLRLFNLIINDNFEIIDLNNNSKTSLININGVYEYNFMIKDINYNLVIKGNTITIKNSCNEIFIFDNGNFSYFRNDNNAEELEHVVIGSKAISFFSKNDIGNGNSYSVLFSVNQSGNKFSNGIVEEKIFIKDLQYLLYEIDRSKNGTSITTTNKVYSANNNLKSVNISSYNNPINVNDYLLNELCKSGYIIGLLSYLKSLIPNFDDYIKSINSNILKIKNDKLSKKVSNS